MITMKKELAEQSSAKEIVGHLLLSCVVAWLLGKMLEFPFQGVAFGLGAVLYLVYLGYKMAYLKAKSIRDLRVVAEDKQTDWEEKQAQLQNLHSVIKRKADEVRKESNAIKGKATALEKIANDNATLGEERRTLTSQVHSLGESLANADKEKRTIKQAFDEKVRTLKEANNKETETLLTKLSIAEKEAISLRNKLQAIEKEEEERSFKKSVKATWSSCSKNDSTMNEKFGKGNWEEYVNR